MKATVQLRDLSSDNGKLTIVRNLSRILDIRILNIDTESSTVCLQYDSFLAIEKVKRELLNIGFPVLQCRYQDPARVHSNFSNEEHLTTIL